VALTRRHLGNGLAQHSLDALTQRHPRKSASLAASAHLDEHLRVFDVDERDHTAMSRDRRVDLCVEDLADPLRDLPGGFSGRGARGSFLALRRFDLEPAFVDPLDIVDRRTIQDSGIDFLHEHGESATVDLPFVAGSLRCIHQGEIEDGRIRSPAHRNAKRLIPALLSEEGEDHVPGRVGEADHCRARWVRTRSRTVELSSRFVPNTLVPHLLARVLRWRHPPRNDLRR
jgi:hypothetical protein